MADMVFQEVLKCGLYDEEEPINKLRCKLITKDTGKGKVKINHPALAVWDIKDELFRRKETVMYLIHLVKVNKLNLTQHEIDSGTERFEIQCRSALRSNLLDQEWDLKTGKEQILHLENGLLDVAHWCLKYELGQNYKYHMYSSNCRQFMEALCKAFNIEYDASDWTDTVCYVAKAAKQRVTGLKCL